MKFKVSVHRIEHGDRDIEVEARDEKEARVKAMDEAGEHEFGCYDAQYDVSRVERIEEGLPKRRMVIFVEGGSIQDIFTDFPMDVHILDGDCQGAEKGNLVLIKDEDGDSNSYNYSAWDVTPEPKLTEHFVKQLKEAERG